MSLYLGENLISGSKPINLGVRNIGEIVASSLPLTDAGLHLLDGSLILGGGIYQGFVDYIADLYAENPSANYFTDEASWQNSVTTYGVCGKFVYDDVNNTVRLPKVTGKIDGTTDINALGDLEPLFVRLPNITGSFNNALGMITNQPINGTGAFANSGYSQSSSRSATGDNYWQSVNTVSFSASRSSSVYSGNGSNTDIHEQAVKMFIYIVIANSTKTEIQSDIDEIATDLNGKADTDLSNINASQSAKDTIIGWGIPDYTNRISIITYNSSSNQYTCPSCGVIMGDFGGGTNAASELIVNGVGVLSGNASTTYHLPYTAYVSKGDKVYFSATVAVFLYFIPLKGAN